MCGPITVELVLLGLVYFINMKGLYYILECAVKLAYSVTEKSMQPVLTYDKYAIVYFVNI